MKERPHCGAILAASAATILLPPLVFVLLYRLPFDTPSSWARERRSVYLTNAALTVLFGTLVVLLGWR